MNPAVNGTPGSARRFARDLCNLAQRNRRLYEASIGERQETVIDVGQRKDRLFNPSRVVLVGDRGVGKTAFLNHLFTVNNKYFDRQSVVWVRCDYTRRADKELTLEERLRWQSLRVIFKYYDRESPHCGTVRSFDFSDGNTKLMLRLEAAGGGESMSELRRRFHGERSILPHERLPRKVDDSAFLATYQYLALDEHVGFIHIVDGLDRIGLMREQRDEFLAKREQVRNYLFDSNDGAPQVILVTMRSESVAESTGHLPFRGHVASVVLEPSPIRPMLTRRLAYSESRRVLSPDDFPEVTKLAAEKYRLRMRQVAAQFTAFVLQSLTYSFDRMTPFELEKGFDLLERVFGTDRRRLFRAMTEVAKYFMNGRADIEKLFDPEGVADIPGANFEELVQLASSSQIMRKHYLFIEALMLMGRNYHTSRYTYAVRRTEDGKTEIEHERDKGEDIFLNVYRYPSLGSANRHVAVFAGCRIIQFLEAHSGQAERHELVSFLRDYFAYPDFIVNSLIDEMKDEGVLQSGGGGTYRDPDELVLSPDKGSFLLARLARTLEYINLALQVVPLPANLVRNGYFPIRAYGTTNFVIDNKIACTINFLRVLRDVEDWEREHFNRHSMLTGRSTSFDTWLNGEPLALADSIQEHVLSSVDAIVDEAFSSRNALRDRLSERFGDN